MFWLWERKISQISTKFLALFGSGSSNPAYLVDFIFISPFAIVNNHSPRKILKPFSHSTHIKWYVSPKMTKPNLAHFLAEICCVQAICIPSYSFRGIASRLDQRMTCFRHQFYLQSNSIVQTLVAIRGYTVTLLRSYFRHLPKWVSNNFQAPSFCILCIPILWLWVVLIATQPSFTWRLTCSSIVDYFVVSHSWPLLFLSNSKMSLPILKRSAFR